MGNPVQGTFNPENSIPRIHHYPNRSNNSGGNVWAAGEGRGGKEGVPLEEVIPKILKNSDNNKS